MPMEASALLDTPAVDHSNFRVRHLLEARPSVASHVGDAGAETE